MKKKTLIILGHTGSLGSQLFQDLKKKKIKVFGFSRKNIKFEKNFKSIEKKIINYQPSIIINCIGFLGLKNCEKNKKEAKKINYNFPIFLAKVSTKYKIKLVHFSTEAVFSGNKKNVPYFENSLPNPKTIYGKTKLDADNFLYKKKNCFIIRLPMLYGPTNKKQIIYKLTSNIIKNKKIFVANDVFSSPVYTPFVSRFVMNKVIKKNYKMKLVHITSNRKISIYNFMKKIGLILKKGKYLIKVKDKFFKDTFNKPKNLGLKTLNKFCIDKTIINKKIVNNIIR